MKKLIAVAVAALSLGAFADDSYLYWMTPSSVSWKTGDTTAEYSYVAIGVMDNATGMNVAYLANTAYGVATTAESAQWVGSGSGSWYANLSTYASNAYSFYIELFNDQAASVGRSTDILSYDAAKAYATTFGTQAPSATAWSTTSFTTAAIPEPTSGLLMLFGLSALALRRKRPLKA